jgi:hypothetical protein
MSGMDVCVDSDIHDRQLHKLTAWISHNQYS